MLRDKTRVLTDKDEYVMGRNNKTTRGRKTDGGMGSRTDQPERDK